MTRYVDKKHGLVIGSDNLFFYKEGEELNHFRAIVWARGYMVDRYSTAHVGLRTPAQHLIWEPVNWVVKETVGKFVWDRPEIGYEPTGMVKHWCEENAPGYGYRKLDKTTANTEQSPTLFFQKRGQALAFTRFIEGLLEGLRFL